VRDSLLKIVPLLLMTAALACGSEEEEPEQESLDASPLPVTAEVARRDTLFQVIESTGRIASSRTQTLTAQIQGEVVQAPGREGEAVSSGDVLFRIASGEAAAALAEAQSAYRSAETVYEFELENYQGELTEQVRRTLRRTTGLEDAAAALARARTQYSNAAVRAGFDGVVSQVSVRTGVTVYPGTRLGRIVDPQNLEVHLDLDERQLAKCEQGQRAYVTVPSLDDTTLVGSVKSVSPTVDPDLRAGRVVVELAGMDELRPGATANTEIVTEVHPRALVVPRDAVLVRDDRNMVFVVEDGKAKWQYVTTGPSGRGLVAIEEGLEEGDQVITSGHYSLAHEAPVAVVN
jgi:RND family efflux transporter MFP subunit